MILTLHRLDGAYAVARLAPGEGWPHWATWSRGLASITRTATETSVVCEQLAVPGEVRAERDFVAYVVAGPLAFSSVGILARLTTALAEAGVPVLAISTYDTDVILLRAAVQAVAESAWHAAGINIRDS
ncbi:MAG: ACT domain-containing protein [Gemmatimonadetes bacterium]|nr:ACT domain-containing protein [Gemmatimonadota bacterium]MCC6773710.1 ACT domain-containing protein [Gemmatimonadaceae bacterium]